MSLLQEAIIKTLAYADIFDYPLTQEEIKQRLIGIRYPSFAPMSIGATAGKQVSGIRQELKQIKHIEEKDGYYFFKGRKELVALRKKRMEWSKKKWQIAQRAARILRHISTLKLIGVSGGLASNNADEEDDIDFFLITAGGNLWMTRLFVTGVLECLGLRRRPGDTDVKDTICVNMIVDENYLTLPKEEQDVFGAYEVALMKPVWQRKNTYEQFLAANHWIEKWLPNWKTQSQGEGLALTDRIQLFSSFFSITESISKTIQVQYMSKRRTTEIVENSRIRFHPQDVRRCVMKEYNKRVKSFL